MLFTLYSCVSGLLVLIGIPFFALYCLIKERHLTSLKQRLGFLDYRRFDWHHSTRIWLHAASVGEVQAAKALISALSNTVQADLIVSTVTRQGQLIASQQLGPQVLCLFAPLDIPWIIKRFIQAIHPTVYICLETELWPNMLRTARQQGVATLLLNGRMSDRSFGHYKFIAGFMRQVLETLSAAAVITPEDREKYTSLGLAAEKITVCGNAKYDLDNSAADKDSTTNLSGRQGRKSLIAVLGIPPDKKILVAGSTHNGEEEALLKVHKGLNHKHLNLVTIIAPRHLNRLANIEAFFRKDGIEYRKLSKIKAAGAKSPADIILVDSIGELASLYAIADFAFCGGSLVERGGHNIMEPAIWGIPPFYGPHMKDFADADRLFMKKKAGFKINSAKELIDKIVFFTNHPDDYRRAGQAAESIAQSQRGAAARQVEIILQTLGERE